ncbi:MAG: PKD domain-containing protein [Thermoplasmata archaeon]
MNAHDEPPAPPPEDELPPPPADIADHAQQYPPLAVKKTKPLATVRRAFVIFEKDLSTIVKHGLISSIILAVFLSIVFYIASFAMEQALTFRFEDGGDGGLRGSGVNPPVIDMRVSPSSGTLSAGTTVNLDTSHSTDNGQIVYYGWRISGESTDVELYGPTNQYKFEEVGEFMITAFVVDDEWNFVETNKTVRIEPSTSDTEPPLAVPGPSIDITVGQTAILDGSNSTDNVGIVDYRWRFYEHGLERVLHGETVTYRFDGAGSYNIELTVRDASGNVNRAWTSVNAAPVGDDYEPPNPRMNLPLSVTIGEEVRLIASESTDNRGITAFIWYVEHNSTILTFSGPEVTFTPNEFGPYDVYLVVRDASGNTGSTDGSFIAVPAGMELTMLSWTDTPFGIDISFNLLTYAYGIALLASVIFVGGLFAKGFSHEITKGTAKVLFFGPISVTAMIFSKILYPLLLAPVFILPTVLIGLSGLGMPLRDVLVITLTAYALAALTMVAAAYGSCLIYIATKKMVIKPSVLSRTFLYLSLLGTLTVFEWTSYLLDQWLNTTRWMEMYYRYGGVSALSPFHQGGMMLSNMLTGTSWTLDLWAFLIPVTLIAGGVLASRRLYSDIFARE